MASPAVRRRRLLLAGFVGILVIAWAMNAIGGPEPKRASKRGAAASPSITAPPLPPSAVPLSAPGFAFSPDACVAFPPTSGPAKGTVFLDAGHGGVDPGTGGRTTSGKRIQEKAATLGVVKAATEQLRAAGYRVVVSRWADVTVGVPRASDLVNGVFNADGARQDILARVACANASGASVLVSVHMNAFGLPSEGGIPHVRQERCTSPGRHAEISGEWGDPALADYYPAWLDNLAVDVTVEGSMLDGAVEGADAVRTVIVGIRTVYGDSQQFHFVGPIGDNGWLEDYIAEVSGRPIGCINLVTRNAAGKTQHIVASYRPRSSIVLFAHLLGEKYAGTPLARYFITEP